MKRTAIILIALFVATSLFAGDGKSCNTKAAKAVQLTGTLVTTGDGDEAKTVFRLADSDKSYVVCHETKSSILKLGKEGANLKVKGKVINCSGNGEELVIETAQKI